MEFAQKLNILLEISGLTGSKVAHTIRVDPSLVSRWRSGTRMPQKNAPVLVQLAACLAKAMPTRHQQALLAQHIPDKSLGRLSTHDLTDLIFMWLNTAPGAQAQQSGKRQAAGHLTPEELAYSNSFAGPDGRQLVLEQLFALFDQNEADSSILFYSSDPADWIQADIAFRSTVLGDVYSAFRNVSTVKLILHNNTTVEDYIALLNYVLPFLHRSTVQIVQIPRYRKELFTNTILIAGTQVAAASHGFAGSENFMTNIYTSPDFIFGLTRDYSHLFAGCERIHTVEQNITLADLVYEEAKMFACREDAIFVGNKPPCALFPPSLLAGQPAAQPHTTSQTLQLHTQQFAEYLQTNTLCVSMPLFTPRAVARGAVTVPGLWEGTDFPLTTQQYMEILVHLQALMERHPRLVVRFIAPLQHSHSLMVQPSRQLCVLRSTAPCTLYTSQLTGIVAAFSTFVQEKHGGLHSSAAERAQQAALLDDAIRLFHRWHAKTAPQPLP